VPVLIRPRRRDSLCSSPPSRSKNPTKPISPALEKHLTEQAAQRRRQAEIRKKLQPLFEQIQDLYARKEKPAPRPYDAWNCPTNSVMYRMKGIRSCGTCLGNGYYWFDDGHGCWGWIRCGACRSKLFTAGEKALQAALF
jgi:hypothetical protein